MTSLSLSRYSEDFAASSASVVADMRWMEGRWSRKSGWTKYNLKGEEIGAIESKLKNMPSF